MDPKVPKKSRRPEDTIPETIVTSPIQNISKLIPHPENELYDFTESSPPVLELSKDESRSENDTKGTRLLRRQQSQSLDFEPTDQKVSSRNKSRRPEDTIPETMVTSPIQNISKLIPHPENELYDFTESSPPVLELSKDESRSEGNTKGTRLLRRQQSQSLDFEPTDQKVSSRNKSRWQEDTIVTSPISLSENELSGIVESSAPILELSKDESRSEDNTEGTRLLRRQRSQSPDFESTDRRVSSRSEPRCSEDTIPKTIVISPIQKISRVIPHSENELSDFIESSPPVLELSKDESRSEDITERTRLLRRKRSQSLDFEPTDRRVSSRSVRNCCSTFYDYYKEYVTELRNSVILLILQLILIGLPIASLVIGIYFAEDCPKLHDLPIYVAVMGGIGLIYMIFWIYVTVSSLNGTHRSRGQKLVLGLGFIVLFVTTIVDSVYVLPLSPSFNSTSTEYCNETFYSFAYDRAVWSIAIVFWVAIIYLPGNGHVLRCDCCSMTSHEIYGIYNVI